MATNFGYATLKTSGTVPNSLNFIFVAEGFMANEITSFNAACQDKMNYMLATSPFKENAGLFNFYSVPVVSLQSGITHPFTCGAQCSGVIPAMPQKFVNSYFGISYDQENIHRFVLPNNNQVAAIVSTLQASIPFYNPNKANFEPIVICNDPNYGGSENSNIATTTLHIQSDEVLMHELNHSLSGCNDEYIGGAIMRAWNTDTTNDPTKVIWKALIPPAGVVQIGREQLWKGYATCKMNTLGVPYCLVCATQLAKSFGQLIAIAGGTPTVPVVYPPVTPPNPSNPDTSNSGGISVIPPYPNTNEVRLQCNRATDVNGYAYHLMTSDGKTEIANTTAWNGNNVVAFTKLTSKTTYLVYVQYIYPSGHNPAHSTPSTFFQFTTKYLAKN